VGTNECKREMNTSQGRKKKTKCLISHCHLHRASVPKIGTI